MVVIMCCFNQMGARFANEAPEKGTKKDFHPAGWKSKNRFAEPVRLAVLFGQGEGAVAGVS
ncbi:hypothetical protein GCM10022409_20040 [Hymenobacter glaciei]|uniref:Uncharacterized protein n=1 Tax=Hymenobacter glaciei TaxID=877209 RepID=A0ABP7U5X1_9BACT